VSWNNRTHINALIIDCDNQEWPNSLRHLSEIGIPEPTYVVTSASRQTAHVVWMFGIGINKTNARRMRLFDGVRKRVTQEMGGDTNFKNHLTKNPFHSAYVLESFTAKNHDLRDFLNPLISWSDDNDFILAPRLSQQFEGKAPGIPSVPTCAKAAVGANGSRVWEVSRHHVYRLRTKDYGVILNTITHHAKELNSPISKRSIISMAKGMTGFMAKQAWANGMAITDYRDIDHGVMTREADARGEFEIWRRLPRVVKLPLAAERTNAIRKGKTLDAIMEAITKLSEGEKLISQTSLGQVSGLSRETIKRYWNRRCDKSATGVLRSYPCFVSRAGLRDMASLSLSKLVEFINQGRIRENKLVGMYYSLAKAMAKRGSIPVEIPALPETYSPRVIEARRSAELAKRACVRRMEKRQKAEEMKKAKEARRESFKTWAKAMDFKAYFDFIDNEEMKWDERKAALAGVRTYHSVELKKSETSTAREKSKLKFEDMNAIQKFNFRRGLVFKKYRKEWNLALFCAGGDTRYHYEVAEIERNKLRRFIANRPSFISKKPKSLAPKDTKIRISEW